MKTIEEIRNLSYELNVIERLKSIQKSLHKLAEHDCNYGLTNKQQKREDKLIEKAKDLSKEIGCSIYYQGDPRGCALYLVPENHPNNRYTDGIALC